MRSAGLFPRIRDLVEREGPLPFARFMDLALYDADGGYYARGADGLGPEGDFITASDVGTLFGEAVARQVVELDRRLGAPDPFLYAEFGCGRGLLARDVLDALSARSPELARRTRAVLVDAGAGMRREAASRVPEALVAGPEDLPAPGVGCVVAVELLDALPVDRVRRRAGRLREVRVGVEGSRLVEVETDPDPEVAAWAERYGAAPDDGDEAEVSLRLAPAVERLASALERGFVVVVDYGDEATRLYDRSRRRGTLLAYRRHVAHEDLLADPGEQDLTAHVNLTALRDAAAEAGLDALGTTTQDRFLLANGLMEVLGSVGDDARTIKRRLQAKQLIHPSGMGRAFRVAIFGKGVGCDDRLDGLADPFSETRG